MGLFFSGWIQTAGAASGRLKGRMTEQRVVSGSQKAYCDWGAESRETSRNRNARFLDSFGFSVRDFSTIGCLFVEVLLAFEDINTHIT